MPRPNATRSLNSEANLARRIAHERERRGWTYEGTAKRLTDAGCPIQPSAIYKIEKADPPRRISVDELVAFSKVFETPVEDLLVPLEVAETEALRRVLAEWEATQAESRRAAVAEQAAVAAVRNYMREHPELTPALQAIVESWIAESAAPAITRALHMANLTDSEEWRMDVDAHVEALLELRAAERKRDQNG